MDLHQYDWFYTDEQKEIDPNWRLLGTFDRKTRMGTLISHLPTPYPDEVVYSILARCCKRANLRTPAAAAHAFFGQRYSVSVELPSHLDALISNLSGGHQHTSDLFIDRHTTFPYYGFFLGESQRNSVRAAMRGAGGAGIRTRLGITSGGLKSPLFLRHCPECDVENRRSYGETYWHRLHQLAGIEVCPKHQVFLEESGVPRGGKVRDVYADAESTCPPLQPRILDTTNPTHGLLLQLAIDAQWLLNSGKSGPKLELVHKGYDFLLTQKGLASHAGLVKVEQLIVEIIIKYPAELLSKLDCMMNVHQHRRLQWVCRLLYAHKIAQPPIKHLLLINFLGLSVATFTTESLRGRLQADSLFGSSPWDCLNLLCKNYKAGTIQRCDVENVKTDNSKVVGRFSCEYCGYTYSRLGPDQARYDHVGAGWVTDYGTLWHNHLRKAWMDKTLNLSDLARSLGATRKVVRRQATRWGLPFPKPGQLRITSSSDNPLQWSGHIKPLDPERLSKMRSEWISIVGSNKFRSIKELSNLHKSSYRSLRKHDPSWLVAHPLRRKKITRRSAVNWGDRDEKFVQMIAPAVTSLMSQPGKPIIISELAICKKIGPPAGLYNQRKKMPKFSAALKRASETKTRFDIRRILWAADEIRNNGDSIMRSKLILLAGQGVRRRLANSELRSTVQKLCNNLAF